MNKRLAKSKYIGGAEYSIADIAIFPWLRSGRTRASTGTTFRTSRAGSTRSPPARRAARRRGAGQLAQAHGRRHARDILFGKTQYQAR
jgi:GST-like protein